MLLNYRKYLHMHICHFAVQCLDFLDHNNGSSRQHIIVLKRNAKSKYKKLKKKVCDILRFRETPTEGRFLRAIKLS